jgi:hypothetical protein
MAIATFESEIMIPARITTPQASGPSFTSNLVNANTKKHAFVLQAPKTGNIAKILIRTNTAATGANFDVRMETVDATTGDPSGTLWGTNTNATVNFNAANTMFTATLTAVGAVTKGDIFAVNLVTAAGSVSVSFCMGNDQLSHFPYTDFFSAAWGKASSCPIVGIEYDDGSYHTMPGAYPWSGLNTNTYNSGSTPDERGLKFKLPFPVRVSGFWADMDNDNDLTVKLYDSDGTTVLTSLAVDKDIRGTTNYGVQQYFFATTASLLANTFYRLTFVPGASNITTADFDVPSAAAMDQVAGGQNFHHTQRTDAGAWTDTTTKRPFMGLIVDGFDDATGSSFVLNRRRLSMTYHQTVQRRPKRIAQSTIIQNVCQPIKRRVIYTKPPLIRKRRTISISYPNVVNLVSILTHRRRRMHFSVYHQTKKRRTNVQINQTFQSLYVKRRKRFTPTPVFVRSRSPLVPQAAVTVQVNVIVSRRRRVFARHEHYVRREQTLINKVNYIPRRRHVIQVPPAVVMKKRRTQIALQHVNTNLVVARPRKVR